MCPTPGKYTLYFSTSFDKINGVVRKFTNVDTDIHDDTPGKQPEYKTVIVEQGTWILYDSKNYNDDNSVKGRIQIVEVGTHLLDFQPKSLRPITSTLNSVSLFEHKNFGGKMVITTSNKASLPDFPIFNEAGVSSIIIRLSRRWEFYAGLNYTGQKFALDPGFYSEPSRFFGQDERIQSVKRL